MATQKRYLDLNGLKYLLSKLSYTKAAETGKFLTGITEKNGVIEATSASLAVTDIPKLGTPKTYSAATALDTASKIATITNTITRDAGDPLAASFKLGVSGSLSLTRADNGDLTIGYTTPAESVKGVKANGYLTLGDDKLLDINDAKLANASTTPNPTGTLLTTQAYVDKQVSAAIAGGVQYKGTTTTVPASPANGDMYKVTKNIDATTTGFPGAKAGDVIIYHTTGTAGWDVIPSGDDVEYTGIKVGSTTVIGATTGGDATFAAGEGLSVVGTAGTVTYSHAVPTGAAATTSGFYKIATDKFGHVTGTEAVAKADITGLLSDYVSTIGGKSGAITLKAASNTNGDVNLSISDAGELSAAIVGLGSAAYKAEDYFAKAAHKHEIADVNGLKAELDGKQAKFDDGEATIASVAAGVVTLKAGIAQTGGKIANSGTDIKLAKIATTGKAEDVTYDKGTTELTATNVQGAITELAGKVKDVEASAGVTSFGGKTGAITLDNAGDSEGDVKFAMNGNQLVGQLVGYTGDAIIASADADAANYEAYTKAENAEKITLKTHVIQENGCVTDDTDPNHEMYVSNITKAEIDALFTVGA